MTIKRLTFILLLMGSLILAACGGGGSSDDAESAEAATTVPQAPAGPDESMPTGPDDPGEEVPGLDELEAEVGPERPMVIPTQTPAGEGALPVVPPGTLIASETQDPEIEAGRFEYIFFEQTGGPNDQTITIEIFDNGSMNYNDLSGAVDAATIELLNQRLDEINFFGLQATYMGPPGGDEIYQYRLLVRQGGIEKMINAQDGYIPREVVALLSLVRQTAEQAIGF